MKEQRNSYTNVARVQSFAGRTKNEEQYLVAGFNRKHRYQCARVDQRTPRSLFCAEKLENTQRMRNNLPCLCRVHEALSACITLTIALRNIMATKKSHYLNYLYKGFGDGCAWKKRCSMRWRASPYSLIRRHPRLVMTKTVNATLLWRKSLPDCFGIVRIVAPKIRRIHWIQPYWSSLSHGKYRLFQLYYCRRHWGHGQIPYKCTHHAE